MANNDSISAVNPKPERVVDSAKVWTTLITNTAYLSGLLTLDYSLKQVGSKRGVYHGSYKFPAVGPRSPH